MSKDCAVASKDFMNTDVAGSEIYQFSTPKKSDGMKRKAENTPKSPATALSRLSLNSPKTPRLMPKSTIAALRTQNIATPTETRSQNKKALTKAQQHPDESESESESSADEHSDYAAEESSESTSNDENTEATASDDDDDFEQPKQLANKRNAVTKHKPVEVPPTRGRGRPKKKSNEDDFIPDSDNYFLTAANKKVISINCL